MVVPEAVQQQVANAQALGQLIDEQAAGELGTQELALVPESPLEAPAQGVESESAVEPAPAVEPESAVESESAVDTAPVGGSVEESEITPTLRIKPGKEDDPDYLRSRANAIYGINQQLAIALEQAKTQIRSMGSELERLKAQRAPATQLVPAVPQIPGNDDDVDTFGADLVGVIERRAQAAAAKVAAAKEAEFTAQIGQLQQQLGAFQPVMQATAEDTFFAKVAAGVPDYERINNDSAFLDWLGEVDPVFGMPRQTALDYMQEHMDAQGVIGVFNTWKRANNRATSQPAAPVAKTAELQRQVPPTTVRAGTTSRGTRTPDATIWSAEDFKKALDPRNKDANLRNAAKQALNEGRVR